jgi:hypothetical protein
LIDDEDVRHTNVFTSRTYRIIPFRFEKMYSFSIRELIFLGVDRSNNRCWLLSGTGSCFFCYNMT